MYYVCTLHRLNMEIAKVSFGLHVHNCTHWLRPSREPRDPTPPPPLFGLMYEGAMVDDISLWPLYIKYVTQIGWRSRKIKYGTYLSQKQKIFGV
jgi:hypothetical protein